MKKTEELFYQFLQKWRQIELYVHDEIVNL